LSSKMRSLNGYKKVQVNTSSPEKLLLMVYGGAIKFLKKARLLAKKDLRHKANVYILKAIAALVELIATLNHDESPEIAGALKKLYVYAMEQLRQSINEDNIEGIDEAINILSQLKSSWEEAFSSQDSSTLQMTG